MRTNPYFLSTFQITCFL